LSLRPITDKVAGVQCITYLLRKLHPLISNRTQNELKNSLNELTHHSISGGNGPLQFTSLEVDMIGLPRLIKIIPLSYVSI